MSRFNVHRRLQKETPNSEYRITESNERARSVIERRQYPRVVPVKPHSAQTSMHRPLFIVQNLWRLSRLDVQTAPEGGSEQRISRHGVGQAYPFGDGSTAIPPSGVRNASQCSNVHSPVAHDHEREIHFFIPLTHSVTIGSQEAYSRTL